jgi:hypothetical protein
MSLKVDVLQGGTNSHGVTVDDFNSFATDFLSDGVVGAITNTGGVAPSTGSFSVNAQGTPNMTVAVGTGQAYVTGTPTSGVSQRLRVVNDASANVTIAANATGGTRYDWLYISLAAAKMKDPAVDSTDVATLVTSRSTSASTDNGTPPTYGYNLAVITVANGATSITNANIALKRTETIPVRDASLTNAKLSTTAGEPGGAWKSWTPSWTNVTIGNATVVGKYTQIGKTVRYKLSVVWGNTTSASGIFIFTLPVTSVAADGTSINVIGTGSILDAGSANIHALVSLNSTTTGLLRSVNTAVGNLGIDNGCTNTSPITWTTNDALYVSGTYEAA